MIRPLSIYLLFTVTIMLHGQDKGFECDGSIYIVTYTQSTGRSVLYEVQEDDSDFNYRPITLSEDRRLTSLAYNVLDTYLYALDVDTYELVKIDREGTVFSLGIPSNLDEEYVYHSGTISPDGAGIYLVGYNPEFGFDNKFYTINLSREDLYAGFLGITGEARSEIHDFATDPLSGEIYGYDNLEGSLAQIGIGGQVSTGGFQNNGVSDIDGIFFNKKGELFGYAATKGFYEVNKLNGELRFLESGPEGTSADACSCPYTSSFQKEINPTEILPCQEFEITYRFLNYLGIGQTWISLRDTLPEGFEIVNIESKIVSSINIVESPPHILDLENLIYLMRDNEIKVTVRAPSDYLGPFVSKATHWDFPFAFGEVQYSDDPSTLEPDDETLAMIVTENDIRLQDYVEYSCDGQEAIISSPIESEEYLWNNISGSRSLSIDETGWYYLFAEHDCVVYYDSVLVSEFLEEKNLMIEGQDKIRLGSSVLLKANLNRGVPLSFKWYDGVDTIHCTDCATQSFSPVKDTNYELFVLDEDGCFTSSSFQVEVDVDRSLYAASAFSPNGDGLNDVFFLQSSVDGEISRISIYNRWGGEIYSDRSIPLNSEHDGWDGLYGDLQLPSGVFIWVAEIEYIDGLTETKSGTITLVAQN